ncbi:MAG: hypothetical protein H5T80_12040, partial [Dietzia sp.]|nr:hypothetical protein [Dietzia sp.]
ARRRALEHIVRTAVEHNYRTFAQSRAWRTYFALLASLPAVHQKEVRSAITARMYDAEREFAHRMGAFYAAIASEVGIRLRRPEAGWESLALACSAVVEGLALRSEIHAPVPRQRDATTSDDAPALPAGGTAPAPDATDDDVVDWSAVRPTIGELVEGPRISGDPDEWTTAGIAILGIIDAFTEPDPARA